MQDLENVGSNGEKTSPLNKNISRRSILRLGAGALASAVMGALDVTLEKPKIAMATALSQYVHFSYGWDYQTPGGPYREKWEIVEYPTFRYNYHGHVQCIDGLVPVNGSIYPNANAVYRDHNMFNLNAYQHNVIRSLAFFGPGGPLYNPSDSYYWQGAVEGSTWTNCGTRPSTIGNITRVGSQAEYAGDTTYNYHYYLNHQAMSTVSQGAIPANATGPERGIISNMINHARMRFEKGWVWGEEDFPIGYMNLDEWGWKQRHAIWLTGGSLLKVEKKVKDGAPDNIGYPITITLKRHGQLYDGNIGDGRGHLYHFSNGKAKVWFTPGAPLIVGFIPGGWSVDIEEDALESYIPSYNSACHTMIQEGNYPTGLTYHAVVTNKMRGASVRVEKHVEHGDATLAGSAANTWEFKVSLRLYNPQGVMCQQIKHKTEHIYYGAETSDPEYAGYTHVRDSNCDIYDGISFIMKDGDSIEFAEFPLRSYYTVREVAVRKNHGDEWILLNSADAQALWSRPLYSVDGVDRPGEDGVTGTMTKIEGVHIGMVNSPVVPTNLDIKKVVIDEQPEITNIETPSRTTFVIHVSVWAKDGTPYESTAVRGMVYTPPASNNEGVAPVTDSGTGWDYATVSRNGNEYTFELADNQTMRLSYLPVDGTYVVSEESYAAYTTRISGAEGVLVEREAGTSPVLVVVSNSRDSGSFKLHKVEDGA